MLLSPPEIEGKLAQLPGWQLDGTSICSTRRFKGFPEAIEFVNAIVAPAEQAGHHPDLEISYNRVTIRLTTHDQGGLTRKDFDLAQIIDKLTP